MWGTAVATAMARNTLIASGRQPDDFAVAQTDRWLRTVEVETIPDAAGCLLGLGVTSDVMADSQRAIPGNLRRAHNASGGWGRGADTPATAFDTAAGRAGPATARERPTARALDLPRGGTAGRDRKGARVSRGAAARWQLAGDRARRQEQRGAAVLDNRVGAGGAARRREEDEPPGAPATARPGTPSPRGCRHSAMSQAASRRARRQGRSPAHRTSMNSPRRGAK